MSEQGHAAACNAVAARMTPRWLRYYTASKLRSDPVFPAAFELLRGSRLPLIDVGCGIGLLPAYLRERGLTRPILGIDIDERKIGLAHDLMRKGDYYAVDFLAGDIADTDLSLRGDVVLHDVLHYLPAVSHSPVLRRLCSFVPPDGCLIIRDALRDDSFRYRATYVAERFAQLISWNVTVRLSFPTAEDIVGPIQDEGFKCQARPLWGKTPFNNYLFVFRAPSAESAKHPGQ